jgi:endonuclease-3
LGTNIVKNEKRVRLIVSLLFGKYGNPPDHTGKGKPVDVLVQTILSQNTSDRNSGAAFDSLLARFKTWEGVAEADVPAIAESIRSGGLGEIKASRIKQALAIIWKLRGAFDLYFLKDLPVSVAEQWLLQIPGVGLKTARCVLLFAMEMPALPVDTHILRVTKRLGLIAATTAATEAHHALAAMVPGDQVYCFHMLVIQHGRRTCRARRPDCPSCVLLKFCPRIGVV